MNRIDVKQVLQEAGSKPVLCLIAGCSGSGKTTFEKNLINYGKSKKYFNKLKQVTTRKRRENESENAYYFITEEEYADFEPDLIARLRNFNGNKYGTVPSYKEGKINTIVIATEAIRDIFETLDIKNYFIILLLFKIEIKDITKYGIRKDRDIEFVSKEIVDLEEVYLEYKDKCNIVMSYNYSDHGKYASVNDIFKI